MNKITQVKLFLLRIVFRGRIISKIQVNNHYQEAIDSRDRSKTPCSVETEHGQGSAPMVPLLAFDFPRECFRIIELSECPPLLIKRGLQRLNGHLFGAYFYRRCCPFTES